MDFLEENIKIQKGIVIQAANVGVYVRNQNKDYPMNGTYAAVVGLVRKMLRVETSRQISSIKCFL